MAEPIAAELMEDFVATLSPDGDIHEAIELLLKKRLKHKSYVRKIESSNMQAHRVTHEPFRHNKN